jgi:hypothetical protein
MSGGPAVVNNLPRVGVNFEDDADFADLLNRVEWERLWIRNDDACRAVLEPPTRSDPEPAFPSQAP